MKLLLSLFFFLTLSGVISAQSNVVKITDPVQYNDYIVNEQNEIAQDLIAFNGVVSDEYSTHQDAMESLGTLTATIDQSITDLNNLKKMDSDYGLKKAAVDLFGFYKRTMESKYVKMIDEVYSETPDMDVINQIIQEVSAEEKGFDAAFQQAQQSFASANGFTLSPNSMQDDIDGSGQ